MLKSIRVNSKIIRVYFNMFAADMENPDKIEALLERVVIELKQIKNELQEKQVETCTPEQAIKFLGVTNKRLLKYFLDQGLLSRRKGGTSYVYFKSECLELASKIKRRLVIVPSQKDIYANNNMRMR